MENISESLPLVLLHEKKTNQSPNECSFSMGSINFEIVDPDETLSDLSDDDIGNTSGKCAEEMSSQEKVSFSVIAFKPIL